MARVRCNCGVTLYAPPGVRTARCHVCNCLVNFTTRITQIQYQVQTVSQYYNSSPTQSNYGYYQQPPPRILHISPNRKKRAVLIGVSYLGQTNSVKGSVNDVRMMAYFLIHRMGFAYESVLVLTEEERDTSCVPTKENIQMAMNWLLRGCQAGDSLVFFYSGHGSRVSDDNGDEFDGFDESLCPVDYRTKGKILDDEINAAIVRPLPYGAKLHTIVDTCRSGTLLDLPFMCKMNQLATYPPLNALTNNLGQGYYGWEDHRISTAYKGTSGGTAICFSACDDHETSLDTTAFSSDIVTGAMTYSFIQSVENEGGMTYGGLLQSIRTKIRETEKRLYGPNAVPPTPQVPQLTSSEKFNIHMKPFMI